MRMMAAAVMIVMMVTGALAMLVMMTMSMRWCR